VDLLINILCFEFYGVGCAGCAGCRAVGIVAGVTTKDEMAAVANFVMDAIISCCKLWSSAIKVCAKAESPPYCAIRLRRFPTAEVLV